MRHPAVNLIARISTSFVALALLGASLSVSASERVDIVLGGKAFVVVAPAGFSNLATVAPKLVTVVQETYPNHNIHAAFVQNEQLVKMKKDDNATMGLVHLLMSSKHPLFQDMSQEKFTEYKGLLTQSLGRADMSIGKALSERPEDDSAMREIVGDIVEKDEDKEVNQVSPLSLDRDDDKGVQMTVLNIQALKIENKLEVYTQANSSSNSYVNGTPVIFSTIEEVSTAKQIDDIRAKNRLWFEETLGANNL